MERSSGSFVSRYLERVKETKSVLCVGLDPTPKHVPQGFTLQCYLMQVIDIAAPLVPVVKPQFAHYAALSVDGLILLKYLVKYAHSLGLMVILDAKRADIGETMELYGEEVFDGYNVDACTFVPYLGPTFNPAWMKWLKQGRLPISMIRTSNPEATTTQDPKLESGQLVYEYMAELVKGWNDQVAEATDGMGGVGGVVGATWPEQAVRCRELAGDDVFFLIPGYGAQGGGAEGAVGGLINSRKEPMGTVNSSRGITLSSWWDKEKKQPREGKPLDLVEAAIKTANTELYLAIQRKFNILL
jgi:orotidine-5'-phosphate decarboxylase